MLKIRDDVDLKELKKFGFKQVKDNTGRLIDIWYTGTEIRDIYNS